MGAARKRPRSRSRRNHDNTVAGGAGANPRIERLRRDFARFRRTHPLRTRIPDSLRNAALAALQDGACDFSESWIRVFSESWTRVPEANSDFLINKL
jgi:hypothetical protein